MKERASGNAVPTNERAVAEHLQRLRDESLPMEARRASEIYLALRKRLPRGWVVFPEEPPAIRQLPPDTAILNAPQVEPDLSIPAWGEMVSTRASGVTPEDIQWLFPKRIPTGKLSVLAGDMGLGKSLLAMWMISIVTRGAQWPGGLSSGPPGSAIYMGAEDDQADTIVPRLTRLGCDLNRVELTTTVRFQDKTVLPFSVTRDLPPLCDLLKRIGDVRLIVIDPVADFLFGVDEHKNAEVRKVLNPLREVARHFGAAIVLVNHLNKSGGLKALYRVSGTHGFVGVGRMNWLVCEHPYDDDRRLFVPIKVNLTARQMGLCFRITGDGEIAWDKEPVEWDADTAIRLIHQEKYGEDKPRRGPDATKAKDAEGVILGVLATGPSAELRKACLAKNIPASTYLFALKRLKKKGMVVPVHGEDGKELYALAKGVEVQKPLPLSPGRNGANGTNGHHSNGANGVK